ncbi:uncharacterized protein LOC142599839 isoform X2 [Balearica regulorum gibbericeps]|uniref:uncharacterized protein LOC142599839 isoform X2 n=1 Tax=Balearica regulorum gibbericeps TaxID=100784 RepID=UPI003F646BDE
MPGLPTPLFGQVLQYRTRCRELEQQVQAGGGSLPGRWEAREARSWEKALLQLEEEHQRCETLAEVNAVLQEHLGKATEVNSALKEDVGKLTADWMRAREELELKASEWRNEREVRVGYGNVRRDARVEWEGILFLAWRTCCVKVVTALRMSWCCLAEDRGVRWRRVSKSWCWKTPPGCEHTAQSSRQMLAAAGRRRAVRCERSSF